MHVITLGVYDSQTVLSRRLSACLCNHAVFSCLFYCLPLAPPFRLLVWSFVCTYPSFSVLLNGLRAPVLCLTVCHHVFFFCAPFPPSVSSLPPLSPCPDLEMLWASANDDEYEVNWKTLCSIISPCKYVFQQWNDLVLKPVQALLTMHTHRGAFTLVNNYTTQLDHNIGVLWFLVELEPQAINGPACPWH